MNSNSVKKLNFFFSLLGPKTLVGGRPAADLRINDIAASKNLLGVRIEKRILKENCQHQTVDSNPVKHYAGTQEAKDEPESTAERGQRR